MKVVSCSGSTGTGDGPDPNGFWTGYDRRTLLSLSFSVLPGRIPQDLLREPAGTSNKLNFG